jgi:MFS family permease
VTTRRTLVVVVAWLAAVAGAVALLFASGTTTGLTGGRISPIFVGLALVVVTDACVGAGLVLRRPGNAVGLLLLAAALVTVVTFLGFVVGATLTEQRGRQDVLAGIASLIGPLGIFPSLIAAGPLVAIVFPDGRLPGPRWRWPAAAIVGALIVGSAIVAVSPGPIGGSLADNPFGLRGFTGSEPLWSFGITLSAATLPFTLLMGFAAVMVRFRRSGTVERAQLKWFVAANIAVGALLMLSFADDALKAPSPTIVDILAAASLSLPPIAIGIAILRYRLFEIDRLIARTVSWGVVTGLLVTVFGIGVVALQAILARFIEGETLAVAASTLVAFALFQPIRRRVQSAVDRRFDRARYDAQRTVADFSDRMRDELDLADVRGDLDSTIRDAISPRSLGIWLRESKR